MNISDICYSHKPPTPNSFELWQGNSEPPREGVCSGGGFWHSAGTDQSCGTRQQGCGFTSFEDGNGWGDGRPVGEHFPTSEEDVFWWFDNRWQYTWVEETCHCGCVP